MTDICSNESLIKEIDFFIQNGRGNTQHLIRMKIALTFLKNKTCCPALVKKWTTTIENWKPTDINLSALRFGLLSYIWSLQK